MSNGARAGASAPVAAKVTDFQRIENRLNELIDSARDVSQAATTVKSKLIGCEPSDEANRAATPEASTFVRRASDRIDRIQELLRSASITLNDLDSEV